MLFFYFLLLLLFLPTCYNFFFIVQSQPNFNRFVVSLLCHCFVLPTKNGLIQVYYFHSLATASLYICGILSFWPTFKEENWFIYIYLTSKTNFIFMMIIIIDVNSGQCHSTYTFYWHNCRYIFLFFILFIKSLDHWLERFRSQ